MKFGFFSDLLFRLFSFFLPYPSLSLRILVFALPAAMRIRHRKGKVQEGTDRKEMVCDSSPRQKWAGEDGRGGRQKCPAEFMLENLIILFWNISTYVALFS